jgi:hypothetical protein
MSFHQASLGPTGAHWLDDPSELSCQDSTGQHAVDDPLLSCKQLSAAAGTAFPLPSTYWLTCYQALCSRVTRLTEIRKAYRRE